MSFEIKNIKKSYGKITPLSDISLNIACGQCVGILGKNGSGKSTLLKMIVGDIQPDGGSIELGQTVKIGYYAQEISVAQAAGMCGFSESHFMKLFRELTGVSFTQYVKHLRLETAANLIKTTDRRVGEIAESVGFRNLSYSTRAFEDRYHLSPSAYRQKK